jgi:hypothetical protein
MSVIFGGNEHVIVGWGEHEIEKRKIRKELNVGKYKHKYDKKYIYPEDVIDSILQSRKDSTVYDIIKNFINILQEYEATQINNFDNIWIMPALSSKHIIDFLENDFNDYEQIKQINDYLKKFVSLLQLDIVLEEIPIITIKKHNPAYRNNEDSIMKLENSLISTINNIEKSQCILATNCEKIANLLKNNYNIKAYNDINSNNTDLSNFIINDSVSDKKIIGAGSNDINNFITNYEGSSSYINSTNSIYNSDFKINYNSSSNSIDSDQESSNHSKQRYRGGSSNSSSNSSSSDDLKSDKESINKLDEDPISMVLESEYSTDIKSYFI